MDIRQESLQKHYEWNGKIEVISRCEVNDRHDLSLAYCDQNKIKDGRYRYSVIISGRVFAYEFDYTSETTAE